MPKTAAQKAAKRERKRLKRARLSLAGLPRNRKRARMIGPLTLQQNVKSTNKARRRAVKKSSSRRSMGPRRGPMNAAYRRARFGTNATDGISIMKTVHNSSVIEDTFAVRREKVANIIGSTGSTFTMSQALYINPGNSVLFPIFSQIAATYEQFRVNECVFSYETEAYAASGINVSAGKVILATNYDPADSQFSSDTQMENYFNSDRGAPFTEIVHDVLGGDHALKDEPIKAYFVNSAANTIAPSSDSTNNKFYDVGLFQLATQGNAGALEIGELFVTYSFTMIRPKQQTPLGQNLLSSHISEFPAATAAASGSAFLGTTGGVLRSGSNIPCVCTKSTFTLPLVGRFYVSFFWNGSVAANGVLTGGSAISALTLLSDNGANGAAATSGNASVGTYIFDVTAAGTGAANTVTISGLTSLAAGTADILISQVPSGLVFDVSEEDKVLDSRIQVLEQKLSRFAAFFDQHPLIIDDYKDEELQRVVPKPLSSGRATRFGF